MRATSATVGNGVSMIVGFDMNRAYSFGTTRSTEANPLANRSVVESQGRSDGTAVKHKPALEYWWRLCEGEYRLDGERLMGLVDQGEIAAAGDGHVGEGLAVLGGGRPCGAAGDRAVQ